MLKSPFTPRAPKDFRILWDLLSNYIPIETANKRKHNYLLNIIEASIVNDKWEFYLLRPPFKIYPSNINEMSFIIKYKNIFEPICSEGKNFIIKNKTIINFFIEKLKDMASDDIYGRLLRIAYLEHMRFQMRATQEERNL